VTGRLALMAGAVLAAWMGGAVLAQPAVAAPRHAALPTQALPQSWPVTITIRTVPPLAGVRFTFDGTSLTTGAGGQASVTQQHNFGLHTLTLVDTRLSTPDRRYSFARWAGQRDPDQAFLPTVRGLPMRADYTVTAGFAASCPVKPRFTYQEGGAVDPARISRVTVRSDTGRAATLRPAGRTWLPCQVPLYRDSTLTSDLLKYSLQSVMVSGTNVVHAGVERFEPGRNPHPTVVAYFHDLTVTAHDALFGHPTGAEALVTLAGRPVRRVPLRADHAVTFIDLPQGNYQVAVKAGGAIISAQSLRLSRNERVDLTAVTPVDLTAVGGALVAAVAGLPLLSGPRRRRMLRVLRRPRKGLRHRQNLRREPSP
jgi:hypothetical protein